MYIMAFLIFAEISENELLERGTRCRSDDLNNTAQTVRNRM